MLQNQTGFVDMFDILPVNVRGPDNNNRGQRHATTGMSFTIRLTGHFPGRAGHDQFR